MTKEINCRQNSSLVPLKGMSHEMDLYFDDMHDQFYKGLNSRRDQFLNFLGAQIILYHKTVFLVVNASLFCLKDVSSMYLVQFSLLLIGQQG
jgi:hypothetical protein